MNFKKRLALAIGVASAIALACWFALFIPFAVYFSLVDATWDKALAGIFACVGGIASTFGFAMTIFSLWDYIKKGLML